MGEMSKELVDPEAIALSSKRIERYKQQNIWPYEEWVFLKAGWELNLWVWEDTPGDMRMKAALYPLIGQMIDTQNWSTIFDEPLPEEFELKADPYDEED